MTRNKRLVHMWGVFCLFYRRVFTQKAEENNLFRNRVTLSLMPIGAVVFHLARPPLSLWKEGDSNVNEGM